jgi:hypothetical protein
MPSFFLTSMGYEVSGTLLFWLSGVDATAQAGVTHGGSPGVFWGRPGLNGSGIGAILTARADENRWEV